MDVGWIKHQAEQPGHRLEEPLVVGYRLLDGNGVGKWLQIIAKFLGIISDRE